ncbi:hypothetical protein G9C98_002700 [Cotesia typhae]|uniref:Uncharacterized protein n=1 Tax=Cotesia typhae TaxID=2053667 RepID=A0A8J5RIJ2_9HYME|nr:hypothetical protein G9C98_002700 [Cotesia typhae]
MRTRVRGLVDKKKRATTKTMNLKHKVDHSTHATPEKGVHGTKMIRDTIYIVGSYICIRQIKLEISRAARVQGIYLYHGLDFLMLGESTRVRELKIQSGRSLYNLLKHQGVEFPPIEDRWRGKWEVTNLYRGSRNL